jgi:hypothetical protein
MNKGKRLYGAWVKVPLEDGGSKEAIFHFYADPELEYTEGAIDAVAQERAERRYKDTTLLSCWRSA